MKLSVIVPAHNEEYHLEAVVKELHGEFLKERIDFEIIIVNDNSKDRTQEIAERLAKELRNIRPVHRERDNGFGRAIKEGLANAEGECAILVMADSSDHPKDVVRIFRKLEEGYDVVYGSRFMRGTKVYNYPLVKLILNRLANHFIRFLFLMKENDITNAFKGYKMCVIRALWPIKSDHFDITAELPLRAYVLGFTKTVVPVDWYGRESGVSKLSVMRMARRYLQTVFRIWIFWISGKNVRKTGGVEDPCWEAYWQKMEEETLLGRILNKIREKMWVDSFVKFAAGKTNVGKVLEAGSGSALGSIFLRRSRGDEITALDISEMALRKARESAKKFDVDIKLVRADMCHMPFPDRAFRLAWNSGTMEHFSEPLPVLKEMGRVSDEVICIVPAKGLVFSLLSFITGIFGKDFKSHFIREDEIFYSKESLEELLKKAGFNDVHAEKIYCAGLFPYIAVHGKS